MIQTINDLITNFYEIKREYEDYKKIADDYSGKIKEYMTSHNETQLEVNDLVCTCKIIESESFDDAKLLNKVKQLWHNDTECPWVDTIEVVNMDALESAIYEGQINPAELNDCKVTKTQTRLLVKKSKSKA